MLVKLLYYSSMLLLAVLSSVAQAQLGGLASSIRAEAANLGTSVISRSSHPAFTVHETSVNGIKTCQFVSRKTGKVFAVTWDGIKTPNLSDLFGDSFAQYQAIENKRPRLRSRAPTLAVGKDLIVKRFDRPRHLSGLAYIPSLLPEGIDEGEIR